jgi:hypothetical protein
MNSKLTSVPHSFRVIKRPRTVSSEASEGLDFTSDSVVNGFRGPESVENTEDQGEAEVRKSAEKGPHMYRRQRMM